MDRDSIATGLDQSGQSMYHSPSMNGTSHNTRDRRTEPILLEVIAPTFQALAICSACELVLSEAEVGERPTERGLAEYPKDWQEDWTRLTEWVYDLAARHGDHVLVRVIDPQSPQGLLRSVRHRVRRYPTWLIDGHVCAVGWDRDALEGALQNAIGSSQ